MTRCDCPNLQRLLLDVLEHFLADPGSSHIDIVLDADLPDLEESVEVETGGRGGG